MLKELIEYIKEYEGDNELDDYLDTRYVRLTDQHYDQIVSAMSEGELESKISSKCPAERFFLHFNETILFVNKQTEETSAIYDIEMVTDCKELSITAEECLQKRIDNFNNYGKWPWKPNAGKWPLN